MDQLTMEQAAELAAKWQPPEVKIGHDVLWWRHPGQEPCTAKVTGFSEKGLKLLAFEISDSYVAPKALLYVRHKDDPRNRVRHNSDGIWDLGPIQRDLIDKCAMVDKKLADLDTLLAARLDEMESLANKCSGALMRLGKKTNQEDK